MLRRPIPVKMDQVIQTNPDNENMEENMNNILRKSSWYRSANMAVKNYRA